MKHGFVLTWVLVFAIIRGGAVHAARGGELPVETFFKNYEYVGVKLSPAGDCLATLAPNKARVALAVVNLENRKANWAYAERNADIAWFEWVNTNRLILGFSKDGYALDGLLSVNRDGSKATLLVSPGDSRTHFFSLIPDSSDEILVTTFAFATIDLQTGFLYTDVSRMNIYTGAMTRAATNPGRVLHWLTDHQGVVRAGITLDGLRLKVLYRPSDHSPWQTLADFSYDEDGPEPVGFDAEERFLLVKYYGDQNTHALYKFDLERKMISELAFRHPQADVDKLIFSGDHHSVAGVRYQTDRPQVFWFDARHREMQARVDLALPQTLNSLINTSRDGSKAIVQAANDRTPGAFYLLDITTSKMEKLLEVADWIHPEDMAEMRPIEYAARDGLKIHGYLTLPKGTSGTNLPLVVNPHGGPMLRDTWGFDRDVQFLANRGYAVLRINFRGSTSYGREFTTAGYKQWGLKQQDDITDGVRWAIEGGIADPKRICIYGASYGGFAALTGVEQTPELYCCAVSYVGVTDIMRTLKNRPRELPLIRAVLAETIGDPKEEKARLEATSPLNHVDRIQVPVFLANGKLDPLVPISTGHRMASELKKRGKLYEFMVKDDEGHGFHKEKDRIEFWTKMDEFLKANLRPN